MMKAALRTKWLKALRGGEWEQCTGKLHKKGDGYCCLGVLARCAGYSAKALTDELSDIDDLKDDGLRCELSKDDESTLIHMNDGIDDFPAIANWIETNVPVENSP